MEWFILPWTRAFDYAGRSRRREYWSFALFAFVILVLVEFIKQQLGWSDSNLKAEVASPSGPLNGLVTLLVLTVLAVPGLAVAVRRLHDTNRRGWWIALPIAPWLFWVAAIVGGFNPEWLFRVTMVVIVLSPFALMVLLFLEGTRGPNRFGDDPKAFLAADLAGPAG